MCGKGQTCSPPFANAIQSLTRPQTMGLQQLDGFVGHQAKRSAAIGHDVHIARQFGNTLG
jgi:hypothetical protein